jgi:hypothetical protein
VRTGSRQPWLDVCDGRLNRVEVDEKMPRMAARFAWIDENRDGFLSRAELQSSRRRWNTIGIAAPHPDAAMPRSIAPCRSRLCFYAAHPSADAMSMTDDRPQRIHRTRVSRAVA